MKEKPLSEKEVGCENNWFFPKEDVKEAVEKLKEFIFNVEGLDHIGTKETQLLDSVITQIDKIFGNFRKETQ